jgi:Mannosyltransferase (PIG-V)
MHAETGDVLDSFDVMTSVDTSNPDPRSLTEPELRELATEPTGDAGPRPAESSGARGSGSSWRDHVRFVGPIVALVLGVKLLVFSFGFAIRATVDGYTFGTLAERMAFWNLWDAPHYLDIARDGYVTTGKAADYIVFFPMYPYATRVANWLVPGDLLTAAFVVSGVASITAAVLLAYLVRADGGDDAQATRASWFLLIFPTAYFLHLPYTESLFLTFLLGAFLAARTGRWAVAGLVGALAAATRLNGVLLLPALMVEAYLQYRRSGRVDRSFLWIGLVGAGFLAYLAINQHYFGNPFHFQDVQATVWFKELQAPWTSVTGLADSLAGRKPEEQVMLSMELVFLAIGLAAAVLAFRFSRPSYAVWALLNVALFASTSWIQSTPRYAITLFPIFLMLAAVTRRQWAGMLASAWSLGLMVMFTALFALGHWAF